MHGVGAADRRRRRLGEAEVADLARRDQLGHRARRSPRSAPSGRPGAGSRGRCVDARAARAIARMPRARTRVAADAERACRRLRGRCRTWSRARPRRAGRAIARPTSRSLAYGPYMSAVSSKVDAELERATDRRHRLRLVAAGVELRHPHAAEPDLRHLEALSERPRPHRQSASPNGSLSRARIRARNSAPSAP